LMELLPQFKTKIFIKIFVLKVKSEK